MVAWYVCQECGGVIDEFDILYVDPISGDHLCKSCQLKNLDSFSQDILEKDEISENNRS
jgi:hypothetical protein